MKILIVDDHALFRDGLAWILGRLGPETEIIAAGGVTEGLALAAALNIDLVLLDICLPGYRDLDALYLFRKRLPTMRIVLLSGSNDGALIRAGLAAGALAFIHKSASADTLLDTVRNLPQSSIPATAAQDRNRDTGISQLTLRQREILSFVCGGKRYKEIARRLDISTATVRNHISRIFALLGVHSRTEAAMLASRQGLN